MVAQVTRSNEASPWSRRVASPTSQPRVGQRGLRDPEHARREVHAGEAPRARGQRPQDEAGAGADVEDVANAAEAHEVGDRMGEAAVHDRVVIGRGALVETGGELRGGLHEASVGPRPESRSR